MVPYCMLIGELIYNTGNDYGIGKLFVKNNIMHIIDSFMHMHLLIQSPKKKIWLL